jgi:hypothetical protein
MTESDNDENEAVDDNVSMIDGEQTQIDTSTKNKSEEEKESDVVAACPYCN